MLRALAQVSRARGGPLALLRDVYRKLRAEGWRGMRQLAARAAGADDYDAWVERFDRHDGPWRAALQTALSALPERPRISVIVPVFNAPEAFLRRAIESVREQCYSDWELCLCNDASTAPHVAPLLDRYAARDSRIKVVHRSQNGHISAASNDALVLATGRFVALLDHDDELAPHALAMIALYAARNPGARLFYSDEDKLTADGQRVEPYFKPDWDPVLILGQNVFSHLGVIETALMREVGGFRTGFEGSQDLDLVLRCAERVAPSQIVHIPHVLYHWRLSGESTARAVGAKPYVVDAALRAVREHLARRGVRASVQAVQAGASMLAVRYALPEPPPLVSIIIPTRDRAPLLRQCVDSVFAHTRGVPFEVIIVDNGSTDADALELMAGYAARESVRVMRIDAPFNFAALNNAAVACARGSLLCLLNNDIEVTASDWLDTLCGYATQPGVSAVGAALCYPDDRLQHGGVVLTGESIAAHMHHLLPKGAPGYFGRALLAQRVAAVTAACLVVSKAAYQEVGGMDAAQLQIAYNDVDLCLKLQAAGWHNVFVPYVPLYHHESASRGRDDSGAAAQRLAREAQVMRARWSTVLDADPHYNPNLSLEHGKLFRLASPPRVLPVHMLASG
ncbi:glycosyltransferase family 2 protein [Chitinasiproducens palmae]|nr:glycosyltransferase family 2 protein [Chitinasiproducens palmae]